MKLSWFAVAFPSVCLCLPGGSQLFQYRSASDSQTNSLSPTPGLQSTALASNASSSTAATSAASTTSSPLTTTDLQEEVAAVLDDETRRIGEGHGIPKLSAEDINFALTELPQILDTDGNTKKLRREESILNDTGPDSAEKWKTWKMDDWLELYVKERTIWGSNTKLINSDYFAKDFWLSTVSVNQCISGMKLI